MPDFTYFGEQFAYAGEFPAFEFAEFQEALAEDDVNNARAMGIALRLAVATVAEKDRGRFRKVSRANRAQVEDWLKVFRDWTAEEAESPTGGSTDSSAGPAITAPSSAPQPVASVTSLTERAADEGPSGDGALALALVRSRSA